MCQILPVCFPSIFFQKSPRRGTSLKQESKPTKRKTEVLTPEPGKENQADEVWSHNVSYLADPESKKLEHRSMGYSRRKHEKLLTVVTLKVQVGGQKGGIFPFSCYNSINV